MGIKEIANKYVLGSLKDKVISREVASELIKGINFDENLMDSDGFVSFRTLDNLFHSIKKKHYKSPDFSLEKFNIVQDKLMNIGNVFNYYGNQNLFVLDDESIVYKRQMNLKNVCSNSYLFISGDEGVLIDTGITENEIISVIEKMKINLKYILITHGHIDHYRNAGKIREKTKAKLVFSKKDISMIKKTSNDFEAEDIDILVSDGDLIELDKFNIQVIETPGHTNGSVCYKINKHLFTGDTLLKSVIGFSDEECQIDIMESIKRKIMILEDNVIIYPGHGNITTLKEEKIYNMYLKVN